MATYLRHIRLRILVTLHEFTARISPSMSGPKIPRSLVLSIAEQPVRGAAGVREPGNLQGSVSGGWFSPAGHWAWV
jgi:hypothetical protein